MSEEGEVEERRRRDTPKPDRPRLPDDLEAQYAPIDELSRRAYTALEEGVAAIRELFGGGRVVHAHISDTGVIRIEKASSKDQKA